MAKGVMNVKLNKKRAGIEEHFEYDYGRFKQEYENDIAASKGKNETLDFVDVTEEEELKDMVKNMVNFTKTPRNCTKEEIKGIGM